MDLGHFVTEFHQMVQQFDDQEPSAAAQPTPYMPCDELVPMMMVQQFDDQEPSAAQMPHDEEITTMIASEGVVNWGGFCFV